MNIMESINNHLFRCIGFTQLGNQLLPMVDYYVLRGDTVYHIWGEDLQEIPSGDSWSELLFKEDLGKYDRNKITMNNYEYIDIDEMIKRLTVREEKNYESY